MLKYALLATCLVAAPAHAELRQYRVLLEGREVGHLKADVTGERVAVDYDYKDNGRGPTIAEVIALDRDAFPVRWDIKGATNFGNKIDESFVVAGGGATWRDATGEGKGSATDARFYIPQNGSPWALAMLARVLLADEDRSLKVLPGGGATITAHDTMTFQGPEGPVAATMYEISGLDLNPSYVALDASKQLFATASARLAVIRSGYEAADKQLRDYAQKLATDRLVQIQAKAGRKYDGPVRIRNVHVFDSKTMARKGPYSVVWNGDRISGVQPNDAPVTKGETVIDGAGGTLVPGMYEMHGHITQNAGLLHLLSGVTSMRDMGNGDEGLDGLIRRIENGTTAAPRITRSGLIEGKSSFSSTVFGKLAGTKEEALDLVRWYAARGYHQIKLYNSMTPEWAPDLVKEAHRLGLRVSGHVPAFSTADKMIEAGFDELTHINQVALGWVLKEGEDTRALLRFTALDRLPALDLSSAPVKRTIDMMVRDKVALDATLTIFENMLVGRNGQVSPSYIDIYDNLPIAEQRRLKEAALDVSAPGQHEKYRGAFDQIMKTIRMMKDRGILIVPGTDLGRSFAYHRELELFQRAGYTAPEVLRLATLGMAEYLGQDEDLGSIENGKYADFFLVPGDPTRDLKAIRRISMVVADGTVYFPSEAYPHFGIRPFGQAPRVIEAGRQSD
jgi:imidazolonepropionase-like amidohydrolase